MSLKCPKHDVVLKRKRVLYGFPAAGNHDNVIIGGCCIEPDSKSHGYECPVDKKVYYLDERGNLYLEEDDAEDMI